MIKRLIVEERDNRNFEALPQYRKDIYGAIWKELVCCPEDFWVALDIPNSVFDNDPAVVTWYEKDKHGNLMLIGSETF